MIEPPAVNCGRALAASADFLISKFLPRPVDGPDRFLTVPSWYGAKFLYLNFLLVGHQLRPGLLQRVANLANPCSPAWLTFITRFPSDSSAANRAITSIGWSSSCLIIRARMALGGILHITIETVQSKVNLKDATRLNWHAIPRSWLVMPISCVG
jgi:hypothetical protein